MENFKLHKYVYFLVKQLSTAKIKTVFETLSISDIPEM